MGKKIIVAGGGHGGLVAGALLSKAGYDVTVVERNKRDDMGHDWTDIFDLAAWTEVGIPLPPADQYEPANDMTFYSPSKKVSLKPAVPEAEKEVVMERRDIYDSLIPFAEDANVNIIYGCEVLGPIMDGNRVVGIKTSQGDMAADMVIDAAGMDSPVRSQLPPGCNIQNDFDRFQQFYIYRAFYDKVPGYETTDVYKVFLLHRGELGISWLAIEDEYTDILIGRFDPLTDEIIDRAVEDIREFDPQLGKNRVRGGQKVKLPVRHPLPVFVCDGYAAIGDSAAMTIPIIGSGIAICARAGKMLADAIIADKNDEYRTESLWAYEVAYFKEIGIRLSSLDTVKIFLTKLTGEEVDFLFDKGVISPKDMLNARQGKEVEIPFHQLGIRALKGIRKLPLLLRLAGVLFAGERVKLICRRMPKTYSKDTVEAWAAKYAAFYRRRT